MVDTNLADTGTADYIILEEEYMEAGRFHGLIKNGGSFLLGNFIFALKTDANNVVHMELRYLPKGNFYTPETLARRKKNEFSKPMMSGEEEL